MLRVWLVLSVERIAAMNFDPKTVPWFMLEHFKGCLAGVECKRHFLEALNHVRHWLLDVYVTHQSVHLIQTYYLVLKVYRAVE